MIKFLQQNNKNNLVIFVHGFTGEIDTWINKDKISFPEMLLEDEKIKNNFDFAYFNYYSKLNDLGLIKTISTFLLPNFIKPTVVKRNIDILELSQYMKSIVRFHCYMYENIIVIAHSMGGLISKGYILDEAEKNNQVKLFLSLAVPHNGSNWATIGSALFKNPQVLDLKPLGDALNKLNSEWIRQQSIPRTVYFYGLNDSIVPKVSAIAYQTKETDCVACQDNHFSIAKPSSTSELTFVAVKRFLIDFVDNSLVIDKNKAEQDKVISEDSKSIDNITDDLIKIAHAENCNSFILNSNQLDYHKEQLGKLYEEQLDQLILQRLHGDIDGAWKALKRYIEDFAASKPPERIIARFYLLAANWSLIDYPKGLKEAERYFSMARTLDKNIDARTFLARKFSRQREFDKALDILKPLDKENVISVALEILIESGQSEKASELLLNSRISLSHMTRQILALCQLQLGNFFEAEREIQLAISEVASAPTYLITAGIIAYWQGIPSDLRDTKIMWPMMIRTGLFTPTYDQVYYLKKSLSYFEEAKKYAEIHDDPSSRLINLIRQAWIVVADLLIDYRAEAQNCALELLKHDPENSTALMFITEAGLQLDEEKNLLSIQKTVDSGKCNAGQVTVLVNIYLREGRVADALEILKRYRDIFKLEDARVIWAELMLRAFLAGKMFTEAENFINEVDGFDDIAIKRMKCIAFEYLNRDDELVKILENLAKYPGTRLDIKNLAYYYSKKGNTIRLLDVALEWLEKYPEAEAVKLLADAQARNGLYEESLETLNENCKLFPDGKLSIGAQKLKMNAHWELGEVDKALIVANSLWEEAPDPNLLLNRAIFYLNIDNKLQAISTLQNGLERNIVSPDVFRLLADLLADEFPDDAYSYAKLALNNYPDDPNVYMAAFAMGFRTGYDIEATKLLYEFQDKFPTIESVRRVSLNQLISYIQDANRNSEKFREMLENGSVPIHLVSDAEQTPLGAEFYSHWYYSNDNWGKKNSVHWPLVYTKPKNEIASICGFEDVFLDYTSCLTAHALDLFTYLSLNFRKIVISPSLMVCIREDINELRDTQPGRVEIRRKLLYEIKRLKLKQICTPEIQDISNCEVEYSDLELLTAAQRHGALIIKDKFSTEIIHQHQVPDDLRELQVYPIEVITALSIRGAVSKEHLNLSYDENRVRNEVVEKLSKASPALLVDRGFLEMAMEMQCLDTLAENFQLLIFDDLIPGIEAEQRNRDLRIEIKKWLGKLLVVLRNLKDDGKLSFGLRAPRGEDKKDDKVGRYEGLLQEMFAFAENNNVLVWCDDRNINSYTGISSAPIVNVFDVLEYLLEKNMITCDIYNEKVYDLLSRNIQYHVPPAKYVVDAIKKAELDKESPFPMENKYLRSSRVSINEALSVGTFIGRVEFRQDQIVEVRAYLMNLYHTQQDIFSAIWTDPEMDDDWKKAASNWLLFYYSDSVVDATYLMNDFRSTFDLIAFKLTQLIVRGLFLILQYHSNRKIYLGYFDWLHSWLGQAWRYQPGLKDSTIEKVMLFIKNIVKDNDEEEKTLRMLVIAVLDCLHDNEIILKFLDHPQFGKIVNQAYKMTIKIEELETPIPKERWDKWVRRALRRGKDVKGKEFHCDKKFNVTLLGDNLVEQAIYLEWRDTQGNARVSRYLEPFAQLDSDNPEIRREWLELARPYIQISKKNDYFEKGLTDSLTYQKYVDELVEMLEQSPHYFFKRLHVLSKAAIEAMPDSQYLFPLDPQILGNLLSCTPDATDVSGEKWLDFSRIYIEDYGLNEALQLFSALPLGGFWSFTILFKQLGEKNILNVTRVVEWCKNNLLQTINPVKQQNIISFLLSFSGILDDATLKHISSVLTNLIYSPYSGETIFNGYRTYICLLRFAWRNMDTAARYENIPKEQKILWSYIYADRVSNIFDDVTQNRYIPYTLKAVADTFTKVTDELLNVMHPLSARSRYCVDVCHPEAASLWDIVFGGTLHTLDNCNLLPEQVKTSILPALTNVSQKCANGEYIIDGIEKIFLPFEIEVNRFQVGFSGNHFLRLQKVLVKLDVKLPELYAPLETLKRIFSNFIKNKETADNCLRYLYLLARYRMPELLLDDVKTILERFCFQKDMKDEKMLQTVSMLAYVIKSLPEQERVNYSRIYRGDLKQLFLNDKEKWELYIEFVSIECAGENTINSADSFLDSLEEMFDGVEGKEISSDLALFINSLMYSWIPVQCYQKLSKLRRKINVVKHS